MEAAQWTAIAILAAGLFGTLFHLGARIEALGSRIDALAARIDALTDRVAGLVSRFDVLDARFDDHRHGDRHTG